MKIGCCLLVCNHFCLKLVFRTPSTSGWMLWEFGISECWSVTLQSKVFASSVCDFLPRFASGQESWNHTHISIYSSKGWQITVKGMEPAHWTRFHWADCGKSTDPTTGRCKAWWRRSGWPILDKNSHHGKLWERKKLLTHTHMPSRVERTPLDTRDLGCIKVVPLEEHLGTPNTKKTRRRASWTAGTRGGDYNLSLFLLLPPVSYYFYPSLSLLISLSLSISLSHSLLFNKICTIDFSICSPSHFNWTLTLFQEWDPNIIPADLDINWCQRWDHNTACWSNPKSTGAGTLSVCTGLCRGAQWVAHPCRTPLPSF